MASEPNGRSLMEIMRGAGLLVCEGTIYNAGQGPYLKASCPKHPDEMLNLRLFTDRRTFHCFDCGWHGAQSELIAAARELSHRGTSQAA